MVLFVILVFSRNLAFVFKLAVWIVCQMFKVHNQIFPCWLDCARQTAFLEEIWTFLWGVQINSKIFLNEWWAWHMTLKRWIDVSWVFTSTSPDADYHISLKIISELTQIELTWCDWDWIKFTFSVPVRRIGLSVLGKDMFPAEICVFCTCPLRRHPYWV